MAVRAEERQHETLDAGRVLMVLVTTKAVTVTRPFIVPVPGPMIVVMVVIVDIGRVLVAGMTTLGVGVSHARLLSKALCL
jgi:hypothetical protein